ncbi:MAG: HAD-IA family hydrolase [Clostridiales Family XIII bacterium]|jgi:pyrophosphatase PpaX|nr:HAD-IA family hydrolase [Clostridiales Family XIII bacterium]
MMERQEFVGRPPRIDTIIFDFDGTLMDTNDAVMSSWQYAARELLGHEFPGETLTATLGEPIMCTVDYLFPGYDPNLVVKTYRRFHHEHFEEMIHLFPGVREMLEELRERGYKLGVVTNRLRRTTDIGLRQFDIEKFFGAVVTIGEAPKDKPAPEHIWFALDKLDSFAEMAALVGDSQNDIIGGHNAGLISIRVAWAVATDDGYGDEAANPDYVIDTPSGLVGLMDRLNS